MGKKSLYKKIRQFSNQLPKALVETHEKHIVKGSEILGWGTITEIDGKPIDPDRKYVFNYPVQIDVNHNRRLRKAFMQNGDAGVKAYLDKVKRRHGKDTVKVQA